MMQWIDSFTDMGMPVVILTKMPDKNSYSVGDSVTFTITINNTSSSNVTNVVLTDIIANETSYVTSSLNVDDISVSDTSFLTDGLMVGDMNSGDSHVVTYQVIITKMPAINPIANDATINYSYTDSTGTAQTGTVDSMTIPFKVIDLVGDPNPTPMTTLQKVPDKNMYTVGEFVTFTIIISNISTEIINNVVLKDVIPTETEVIPTSVTVGGQSVQKVLPTTGIPVGSINADDSMVVTYKILINKMPSVNPVSTDATVDYDYTDSTGAAQHGSLKSTTIPFTVNNPPQPCCCCCCCYSPR